MKKSIAIQKDDITEVVEMYADQLYRICVVNLRNESDAQDVVQETFIKYMTKSPEFVDQEHKKAWLITVAGNGCRDLLRSQRYRATYDWDELAESLEVNPGTNDNSMLELLLRVPDKYRLVLELHYVEGYSVMEIARIIGKSESAVKMRLSRGRSILEKLYEKECV